MFDVYKIREDFPLINSTEVYGNPLVYLDNAATAQKPRAVIEKMNELHFSMNANIHRGVHYLSEQATAEYEKAREVVRDFINAADKSEIIFTSGATASINTLCYSFAEHYFKPGDNIIVSEMEHHSNIVPWQILCERKRVSLQMLPIDDTGRLMSELIPEMINDRTRIIALSQCSNVLGTQSDIKDITSVAHSFGVPVLVDGCQGIVHSGADVQAMDCDFYAFSAHKLYGPTGVGILYGKKELLDELPPFMGGGEMIDQVSFKGTTFAPIPLRFEAGTPNYIGAIGLAEAIHYLNNQDLISIHKHEKNLLDYATSKVLEIEGLEIYGTTKDKASILSFNIQGIHAYDLGMILDKQSVAIRTGNHCAEPLMQHFKINGTCRASFAMYNTLEEVDIFINALERAVKMLR